MKALSCTLVVLSICGCVPETDDRGSPSTNRPGLSPPSFSSPSIADPRVSLRVPDDPYLASFDGWRIAGPTNWDPILARAARAHLPFVECDGYPAAVLLKGQMMQESSGIRTARSPTGPVGLMMLSRAAADQVGVRDRLDARDNIHGGTRYLRWSYDIWTAFDRTCRERLGLGWRTYVKGPGTMLGVQKRTGAIMPADFDPHLDAEGREYESRILARIGRET